MATRNYYAYGKSRFYDAVREPCEYRTPIEGFSELPLCSIEEAIEPLIPSIPDIEANAIECKKRAMNYRDAHLSSDEIAAIMLYTMEWNPQQHSLYYILNTKLREKDRVWLKPWFLFLRLIITGLSRLPKRKVTVYRGITLDMKEKYPDGSTTIWWGFSSCSTKRCVSENEHFLGPDSATSVLFIIHCRRGIDVSKYSYYQREKEILLLPATTLQVVQIKRNKHNIYEIHLQEIEPEYQLIDPVLIEPNVLQPEYSKIARALHKLSARTHSDSNTKFILQIASTREGSYAIFRKNNFTADDIESIIQEVVVNKECRQLFLRGDEIAPQGAIRIGDSLKNNPTLQELFITDIQIGDAGVQAIAEALLHGTNSKLVQLSLSNNGITDEGAKHLARMLKTNQSLTHFWLTKNLFSDEGMQCLTKELVNHKTLIVVSFERNTFSKSDTVDIVIEVLEKNQIFKQFQIQGEGLSPADIRRLKPYTKSRIGFKLRLR